MVIDHTCTSFSKQRKFEDLEMNFFVATHRMIVGTHSIVGVLDVNGLATDASAVERDIPACAAFNAPTSLAPSPHMET